MAITVIWGLGWITTQVISMSDYLSKTKPATGGCGVLGGVDGLKKKERRKSVGVFRLWICLCAMRWCHDVKTEGSNFSYISKSPRAGDGVQKEG